MQALSIANAAMPPNPTAPYQGVPLPSCPSLCTAAPRLATALLLLCVGLGRLGWRALPSVPANQRARGCTANAKCGKLLRQRLSSAMTPGPHGPTVPQLLPSC